MNMNRRDFLISTAMVACCCGCPALAGVPSPAPTRLVNAGPADKYAADGVYSTFSNQGFFIVRQGKQLFALSSICTHRRCKLKTRPDHSYLCPCHGSTFDPNGHVTHGPARRNLPILPTSVDPNGQLMVTVPVH